MKLLIVIFILHLSGSNPVNAQGKIMEPDSVIACIGAVIKNSENITSAKLFNRTYNSSEYQLFVLPYCNSKMYLFSLKGEKFKVLHKQRMDKNKLYYFPSENKMFSLENNSTDEYLILIITSEADHKLENIKGEEFKSIIDEYLSRDQLTDDAPKIINIGGNFRGIKNKDEVLKKYSGLGSVSREYHFEFPK